jgi:hypothetical protein
MPKSTLTTAELVQNKASIVFDTNPPIDTPVWANTIDKTKPSSHMFSLPSTETSLGFAVQWVGTDEGSGIKTFTVYSADNGGPFVVWQQDTTATSATFTGQSGHKYEFYSIALDFVGNVESPKTTAEATTTVVIVDSTPPIIAPQISGTIGTSGWYRSNVSVSWNVADPESGLASSSGCTTTTLTAESAGVTLTCLATNGVGLSSTTSVTIKIDKTPPVISGMPLSCNLWPPNHKMVQVAKITAADALSGLIPASLKVTGVSNEPSDPKDPDIEIKPTPSGGITVQLRADRLGNGNGRVYTLVATAADLAGNQTNATATCTVPHDQEK